MSSFKCGVCLQTNSQMLNVDGSQLKEIYEKLTRSKRDSGDERPRTVCYICVTNLEKCRTLSHSPGNDIEITTPFNPFNPGHQPWKVTDADMTATNYSITNTYKGQVTVKQEPIVKEETPEVNGTTATINSFWEVTVKQEPVDVKEETPEAEYSSTDGGDNSRLIKDIKPTLAKKSTEPVAVKEELLDFRVSTSLTHKSENVYGSRNSQDIEQSFNNKPQTENRDACFYCDTCNEKFALKEKLISHLQLHKNEKPYQCNTNINLNKSLVRERPYACNQCNKSYITVSHLKQHMLVHAEEKPFSCKQCFKGFIQFSHLKQHVLVHTGEKPFTCNQCNKAYGKISHLKQHMLVHTGEKPYKCNECKKGFSQFSHLKQHILVHTGEKSFTCNQCDKSFRRANGLKRHFLVHTGEKPYTCTQCNKGFSVPSHLKEHMISHAGEKPFTCHQCDKSFGKEGNLKRHLLYHNGEKPYICAECNKGFSQAGNLKQHMLIHSDKKPHACNQCYKYFNYSSNLKQHMRIHLEKKPHVCNQCNKCFNYARNLKQHMLIHTGE